MSNILKALKIRLEKRKNELDYYLDQVDLTRSRHESALNLKKEAERGVDHLKKQIYKLENQSKWKNKI